MLKKYKYMGGDLGLTYRFFYNPIATKLVEYTPEYIAPNLITLFGFLFTVLPCILLFVCFGINFSGPVSNWWFYLEGISYLLYRILDEIDGK